MWPLLVLSILSMIIIVERLIFFAGRGYKFTRDLDAGVANQYPEKINSPILKVVKEYRRDLTQGEEHALNLGGREAARQLNQHERGLKFLATIGAISPLLGLLGTVWGMVQAFAKMAELGDQVTAGDFASGIWTGLLTTVAGLLVAIPAVTAARMFEAKVDQLSGDLNELASHLKERHFPS